MYHPTAGHGGFLVDFPWQQQMVQGIKELVELPDEDLSSLLSSGGERRAGPCHSLTGLHVLSITCLG